MKRAFLYGVPLGIVGLALSIVPALAATSSVQETVSYNIDLLRPLWDTLVAGAIALVTALIAPLFGTYGIVIYLGLAAAVIGAIIAFVRHRRR